MLLLLLQLHVNIQPLAVQPTMCAKDNLIVLPLQQLSTQNSIEIVFVPRPPKWLHNITYKNYKTVQNKRIKCGLLNIRSLSSTAVLVNQIMTRKEYARQLSSPTSHINTHIPQGTRRGAGVAAISNSSLPINLKPKEIIAHLKALFVIVYQVVIRFS